MDTVVAIISWLATNWQLVLVVVFGLLVLVGTQDWLKINQELRDLFLLAEKALAGHIIKSGPEAMKAVVLSLYGILPLRVRAVLKLIAVAAHTTDLVLLERFAQWVYDRIKAAYNRQLSVLALSESRQWCTFVKRKL
jgi:hypothetical protein